MLGEEDGGLAGGVAATDDGYRVGAAYPCFLMRCGVVHACSFQRLDPPLNGQLAVPRPGGEHNGPGVHRPAVRQSEHMVPGLGSQTGHFCRHQDAGAELPGLEHGSFGQFGAGDPGGGESQIILDPG